MIYLPVGKYSTTAYHLEETGVSIHSIEELCYFIKENATTLEEGIMRVQLAGFIEKELELPELGSQLMELISNKGSLAAFVRLIFETSGYVSVEEMRSIESILRKNSAMGVGGRRKSHGDYHLYAGRYLMAEREYRQALDMTDEVREKELYAACEHNLGCALAGMFLYDSAAECFRHAYELSKNEESYIRYLTALRLGGSRERYARIVNERKLDRNKVAKVEALVAEAAKEVSGSDDALAVKKAVGNLKKGDNAAVRALADEYILRQKDELRGDMETD